jgi:hypothetical protein
MPLSWGPIWRGNQVGAEQRKPYLRKCRRKGLFGHTSVELVVVGFGKAANHRVGLNRGCKRVSNPSLGLARTIG